MDSKRQRRKQSVRGRRASTNNPQRKKQSRRRTKRRKKKRNSGLKRIAVLLAVLIVLIGGYIIVQGIASFIDEVKYEYAGERYPVKGVDVSSYQKDVDWKGLENEGISFAFIKATEGTTIVDDRFKENWKEAHRTKMEVGAYHFLSYDTDGNAQADNFINTVNRKWGMLPPVVDVEFYGKYEKNNPSRAKVYEILDPVLNKLENKYGHKPIIYTNTYIYNTYISEVYDDYPVWISNPEDPQYISETLTDGREWTFCQYTFHGRSEYVADGEKYVDMNVFNGTKRELKKYNWK